MSLFHFHTFKLIKKNAELVYEDAKQNKPLKEIVTATGDVYGCKCSALEYRNIKHINTIQIKKEK